MEQVKAIKNPDKSQVTLAVIEQVLFLFLGSIITDGGKVFLCFVYAGIAFWIGVVILGKRRPKVYIRTDSLYMLYGLPILSMLSIFLCHFVWYLRSPYWTL